MGRPSCLSALAMVGLLCTCAFAGTDAGSMVEVVVAHHTENLSWTREYERPGVEFTVYSKSMPPPVGSIVLPNVGRESHTFLYHIVRNYHRLADWTVFTQATRPSWGYHGGGEVSGHLSDTVEFADYLRPFPNGSDSYFVLNAASQFPSSRHTNRVGFMIKQVNESMLSKSMCPPGAADGWTNWWWDAGHPHLWAKPSDISMLQFYHRFVAVDQYTDEPLTLTFAQGARFALSRERIHARPREYYVALLEQLSQSVMPMEGYWMEAAWYDVFHPEALQSKHLPCTLPPNPSDDGVLSIPEMQKELVNRVSLHYESDGSPVRTLSQSYAYAYAYTTSTTTTTATPTTTATTTATTNTNTNTITTTGTRKVVKMLATIEGLDFNTIINDLELKTPLVTAHETAVRKSLIAADSWDEVESLATSLKAGSVILETVVTYRPAAAGPSASSINAAVVALKSNLQTEVALVTTTLGSAVTGTVTVQGIYAEEVAPPPPPGVTTTVPACTWKFMHSGYCFAGGQLAEEPSRIGGWVDGSIADAQAACCSDDFCGGFHWDSQKPDYVLLDVIGEAPASPPDGTRRQCWKKHTGTDNTLDSGAAPLSLGPLAVMSAVALACFGAAAPLHSA